MFFGVGDGVQVRRTCLVSEKRSAAGEERSSQYVNTNVVKVYICLSGENI